MCVARVNYNNNYPGAETSHRGSVIAYSTDGSDWSDYTFYDEGSAYPNQPRLFMFNGYVYYSRGASVLHGTVAGDNSEIEWIERLTGQSPWYQNYIYTYRTFQRNTPEPLARYDPRSGYQDQSRDLAFKGSIDFAVWDEDDETIMSAISYVLDSGIYIGEPWVCAIKRNSVGSGPIYTERLIFMGEIPGDYDSSDAIKIYNFNAEVGDIIQCDWLDVAGSPNCSIIGAVNEQYFIDFESCEPVTNAKFIYEIIK
jgi:hypothetical protein